MHNASHLPQAQHDVSLISSIACAIGLATQCLVSLCVSARQRSWPISLQGPCQHG
jgi:hypothetical protein